MLYIIIALVVGFIAGALVFRNNAKKAEQIVQDTKTIAASAKNIANNIKKK